MEDHKTTVEDLCRSATAAAKGINNAPATPLHRQRLESLAMFADAALGVLRRRWPDAHVSSGYRSPLLNAAVKGSVTSDHPHALGVDFGGIPHAQCEEACRYLFEHLDELPVIPQQILAEVDHPHCGLPDEVERERGYAAVMMFEQKPHRLPRRFTQVARRLVPGKAA